jgi:ADP-ribosyl-[dinitrogen reductase] hydrolase
VSNPDPDKALGSLLGLAVCEALCVPDQEFPGPDAPLPGEGLWGDGTAMALSLAESLVECGGVDQRDQMIRYTSWFRYGHMSAAETCGYIDDTVKQAILRFERTWNPEDETGAPGDACLARVAPVAIRFADSLEAVLDGCARSTRTTHSDARSLDACRLLAAMIHAALTAQDKDVTLRPELPHDLHPEVAALCAGPRSAPDCLACAALAAAMAAFRDGRTFSDGCRLCLPHGPRAMAAYGQLAGAWHGAPGIPQPWRASLARLDMLTRQCLLLLGN